ncbi:MAG TPA: response regulator [Methylomirabilota bacterium]|nr:response regulator [Methylomirabilota bacterium]
MKTKGPILLVEDDADDVFFISRALKAIVGLPLDVVNDGVSAIEYLSNFSTAPSLIVLDLNLPRKSGIEVLRWIRSSSRWRLMIVLVLTSSTAETDMTQAYSLGANSYIIKPADATKLMHLAEFIRDYWLTWNQQPPST